MSFTDLLAFKKSFSLAMKIFEVSKSFPKEEKYSLIDQIRRSSRSVSANISEAYRKRQYPKYFVSKLSDSDAENQEIGKLINYMINNPGKFGVDKTAN
jgi:four helix bundle protein